MLHELLVDEVVNKVGAFLRREVVDVEREERRDLLEHSLLHHLQRQEVVRVVAWKVCVRVKSKHNRCVVLHVKIKFLT